MSKARAIAIHSIMTCIGYIFLGYVAIYHLGWLDGIAAFVAFSTLIGAIRTKVNWDDLYP